jgi:putative flippase GtrA
MDIVELKKKFLSFATVGGILTILSLGSQVLFIKYLNFPLRPTYVCINGVLIMLSFYLNSKFTFKNKISFANTIRYYLIYLTSMLIGYFLLGLCQSYLPFEDYVFPFLVLPFTLTFNFVMSSLFLTGNEEVIETETLEEIFEDKY